MDKNKIVNFVKLIDVTESILDNEDIDWEYKYDYIFRIFKPIAFELMGSFNWLDLDTSYEEDATNFFRAAYSTFCNWDGRNHDD